MPNGEVSLNNRFIGNLGPMSQYNCYSNGVSYAYNVWKGAACGSTDLNVSGLGFLNSSPGSFDLHLAPGSPALNHGDPGNYPSRDFDGQSRPQGSGPDAGADESG
jgi:hypothetical protein